jgi:hypothetical protein
VYAIKKLLEQVKDYIEACEETISVGLVSGLVVEELIDAGKMPQIYDDVLLELLKF